MDYLGKLVQEHRPNLLVNVGDTLDTFGTLEVRDGVTAAHYLWELTRLLPKGSKHIVLRGNHDTADKEGLLSSAELIAPEEVLYIPKAACLDILGCQYLFLPHSKDFKSYEALIERKAGQCMAIFAHTDWIGCRLTPAYVSKDGLDPAKVSKLCDLIFAGHYHAPATVGNVHFVGAPLYQDFRDLVTEDSRGFLLWERENATNRITRIPNPFTYRCHKIEAKTEKNLQKDLDRLLPEAEKSRVKVYVPKKLMEKAEEIFRGFLWSAVYPLETEREGIEFAAQVTLKTSPEEAVKKAALSASDEYDKGLLEKLGMSLFQSDA
jgi:predicted phosphodiesterase